MFKRSLFTAAFTLLAGITASAATLDVGTVAFNVTNSPLAEVDIVNLTGPNSLAPDFPITTALSLSNLSLTVDFASGAPEVFGSSSGYFTLDADGLSFDGQDIFNTTTSPVTQVTLTGDFSTTSVVSGGTPYTIGSTFSATINPSSGTTLADGDFAVITATSGTTPPPPTAPEPSTWLLLGSGLILVGAFRLRGSRLVRRSALPAVAVVAGLGLATASQSFATVASSPITLAQLTSPASGVSGTTDVWITGSGFPSGSFSTVNISLASTCDASGTAATALAERVVVGSTERIEFMVPASLATGSYYVSVSGSTTGGAFNSGTSCSKIQVTKTNSILASCNPGSSMGILAYNPTGAASTPVTAYVPNGYWDGGSTGVQVVPLEGAGSPATVTTSQDINSCSSNSITGETVCIDNFTGIYLINGSTLSTTLTSGSTSYASFSGGSCENCTVAVNEAAGTKGQAVIGMGYSGAAANSALQFVDLASNTLGTPVPMTHLTSEDILWDPFRNLVLSPDEQGNYSLYQVAGGGVPGASTVTELSNTGLGDVFDSAAEDCTTQIALASIEGYPPGMYITDLSQKTVSGSSFTAPGQTLSIPEFGEFSALTDGIAVAPGSTHLGVITGEFGGNQFAAYQLPATAGSGTPALVDYVAAILPSTPDGCGFAAGYDPHTTTAYTSPNNNKAYGVLADWAKQPSPYIAVVDLAALLKAPRKSGIYPSGDGCASCVNVVDPSYDLVANGVVHYVATGNPIGSCGGLGVAGVKAFAVKTNSSSQPKNVMPKIEK